MSSAVAMSDLRILLLYESLHAGQIGGVEERTLDLARGLAARGHSVVVSGFAPAAVDYCPGVRIVPLGPKGQLYSATGRRSALSAWRWAWAMKDVDYSAHDVIDAAAVPFIHLAPLALGCRRAGRPLVVTWSEWLGPYWKTYGGLGWPVFAFIERMSLRLGRRIVAASPYTAARLSSVTNRAVETVSCGIPVARIRSIASNGTQGNKGPVAVYAGRLMREKRVDLLIEATARLAPDHPLLRVEIIGDGPERARLEELSAERGLRDVVVFRGLQPAKEDVWRYFQEARIAVQPSAREGFGLFPAEAMAAGLPVVFCDAPDSAIGELVRDGEHGIKTAPSPIALASAMARLLDDDVLWRRYSANAAQRAEAFDFMAMAEATERIYRDLLGEGEPGAAPVRKATKVPSS